MSGSCQRSILSRFPTLLAVSAAAIMAACGGDGSAPTEPSPASTEPPPAPGPSASLGGILVNTSTTGLDLDEDGYTVALDGTRKRIIADHITISFPDVPTGDHTLKLSGVQDNCAVDGSNPQPVTVLEDNTTRTIFDVTCFPPGGPPQE